MKPWPTVSLGEVLRQRTSDVHVDAARSYQFAGVYCFGRGVFRSQERLGNQFAYQRLTQLRVGDFVYPKLMAWEGAGSSLYKVRFLRCKMNYVQA